MRISTQIRRAVWFRDGPIGSGRLAGGGVTVGQTRMSAQSPAPAPAPAPFPDPVARMADLLARIAETGDRAAFADLFGFYAPRVKAYLLRLGADDGMAEEITQEVMLTVWQRAESYNPALAAVGTWIFTIARNRRIDRLRRERRPEYDPDDPALLPDPAPPADAGIALRQSAGRLRRALENLPPEQAHLVRLAYFADRTHRDIADSEGLPLGTVKSRLRLALERLRSAMKD